MSSDLGSDGICSDYFIRSLFETFPSMLLAENWSFFKLNYVVFPHLRNVVTVIKKKKKKTYPKNRPTTNVEQIEMFLLWDENSK